MTEREYLIALYSFLPFGPARTELLIKYFGSSRKAWKTKEKNLSDTGLNSDTVNKFLKYRERFDFKKYFSNLKKLSIKTVVKGDKDYPINLRELQDAPLVLYVRGCLKSGDINSVAIVGSRKMTSYGKEVTRKFAGELGKMGIAIVSGLAFGVDFASHQACIESGGRCIAVLASGVDVITPRSNEWLGRKIITSGGAVVSEFPPGTIPQRHFFPFRNRIISGLSRAVIVIEGTIKSGTFHTVRHAANQGKPVFAVPGQITSPMSQGPLYLIKNGAKVLTETKDILEELSIQLDVDVEAVEKAMPSGKGEIRLLKVLEKEELHIDEISRLSGYSITKVSSELVIMELKGLVRSLGNGMYKKV